jgi:hypothetical protein
MSFAEAASLPLAFVLATRAVGKALNLPATWPRTPINPSPEVSEPPRRLWIFGGNSAVGSSATQLLRHVYPDAQIGVTVYGEDKDDLLQEAIRMVEIGANYAIDGSDPDTVPELQEGSSATKPVEVAISFPHPSNLDTQIIECLGGPNVSSTDDLDVDVSNFTGDGYAMDLLGRLLRNEEYKVAFSPRIIGESLEAVSKSLRNGPEVLRGAKHVVLLQNVAE